jgi:light-regulated signal transduction histidine kinase (bacteriophytochrome)
MGREHAIGQPFLKALPAFNRFPLAHTLEHALKGHATHLPALKLFDEHHHYDVFLAPLFTADGRANGSLMILHDVTELRGTQRTLDQTTEELRAVTRQLSNRDAETVSIAFAASQNLHHPLRKIQSFINLLHARESGTLSESGRDYMKRMSAAAARVDLLIEDLIAYMGTSTGSEERVSVDLNVVLHEVLKKLDKTIKQTGAVITHDQLPTLTAVPGQMYDLFYHLLTNALQSRKPDATPRVTIAWEAIPGSKLNVDGLSQARNYVAFTVADNGVGFDAEQACRLFDLFFAEAIRGDSGSGMGLALCKKIAESHEGTVAAKGKPGVGASFTVYLPM